MICTLASSETVVRKRIRIVSRWQSPFGVKLWTRLSGSCETGGETKWTPSTTSGSLFTRCAQAKAATVARTSSAKTTAAALSDLFGRFGIVLADHHRNIRFAGHLNDFAAHLFHFRDRDPFRD